MYARGALTTPWCDPRYSLMTYIVPATSDLLILGSMLGSLYLSLSLPCPTIRCIVSSCTPIIPNIRCISTYDGVGRQLASGLVELWLIPVAPCLLFCWHSCWSDFLTKLQISSTFLSMRTLRLSGLSSACFLMSNLAASGLNTIQMYISLSHKAIISGPCSQCICWILFTTLQFIIL